MFHNFVDRQGVLIIHNVIIFYSENLYNMTNVTSLRSGKTASDREFCQKLDELVRKFNRVAAEEIMFPEGQVTGIAAISDLEEALEAASDLFYENLTKTTMPRKIESLKEIFGALGDMAMDALRDLEIQGDDFLSSAIDRVVHVLDVMNDDASDYAPELVRSDEIYQKEWNDLLQERDRISDDLRGHLPGLYDRLSAGMPG